jgi:hypothetical protein
MAQPQVVTIRLERQTGAADRWSLPALEWSSFHLKNLLDDSGNSVPLLAQDGSSLRATPRGDSARLYALVEIDPPDKDIEAAKLALEREKAKSEDYWRSRTYLFTIGSALLTAIVTITVALIARPSPSVPQINLDAVVACHDSLQRLPTLARLKDQTADGLATAIDGHVQACDGLLQDLTRKAAKTK